MATLKQRLHRKNASGTYDTIHFESTSDLILRPSGRTVEQDLADYLPQVQDNDNVPESLQKLIIGNTKGFIRGRALSTEGHTHNASDITAGSLSTSRLPVIPVNKGGTGRSTLTSGYFLRGNGTGAVTMSSVDDVKEALGISSGGGSYDIGSSGVGTIVKWANKNWIICHTENGLIYLAGLFFVSTSQKFDSGGSTAYAGSDLAQACVTYQNTIPSDSLALAVNTTVNGVTNKIFVASYEQMNGGFMLFYSNSQRELMNTYYWTSSSGSSGGVWYVRSDGGLSDGYYPTNSRGFRPFVALRL